MCNREPNTKMCVQVRDQCTQKYANLPAGGQRLCRQIGAAPKPDAPIGMHTA